MLTLTTEDVMTMRIWQQQYNI